jgi:hypothetical protein
MSQKALALKAYSEAKANYLTHTDWAVLNTVELKLVPVGKDIPEDINSFIDERTALLMRKVRSRFSSSDYPLFVRACPLNPRPGVLESSRADDLEEVDVVARRIITTMMSPDESDQPMYESGLIDPNGMLIVQPFINADASAVVAPGNYILMGRDNDGITAGKDGLQVAIPLGDDPTLNRDFSMLDLEPNHIEIEFVSQMTEGDSLRSSHAVVPQKNAMVQLRGSEGHRPIAPAPKGVNISGTFHGTERITINHIHLVSDNTDEQLDLMEQALREGMPEGSVVLHPNGSHLSHHAGQCFKYGVPYIASADPQVGEQWTQAALGWVVLDNDGTYEPQPYDPLDFTEDFMRGFDIGFSNFARSHGWLSNHFHQFIGGPIGNKEDTAMLAGAYTAWLINATLSVGFGEIRHTYGNAYDSTALVMATAHAIYGEDAWTEVTGNAYIAEGRRSYYAVIEKNPITLRSVVEAFAFLERVYSLEWSSSYGGVKYRQSCENGRLLAESVIDFFAESTDENFKRLISTANLVEHNVHNNGFFFNKFISKTALDWGTDPSTVRVRPAEFFSVYFAAQDICMRSPRHLKDITDILTLSKSITISELKAKPLGKREDVIGQSAKWLSQLAFRHPNGKYSQVGKPSFLHCGVDGCIRCVEHDEQLKAQVSSEIVPMPAGYEASFPIEETGKEEGITKKLKALSSQVNNGQPLTDFDITVVAHIITEDSLHMNKTSHKYLANIVAGMNTEQLQLFAKLTKKE